jgi:hypothetical protein
MISAPSASRSVTLPSSVEILGPDAEDDLPALVAPQGRPLAQRLGPQLDLLRARHDLQRPVVALQRRLEHVHCGAPDEAGDEEVDGVVVELLRLCRLLQLALAHHGDAVAHGHRLDLVVRHVDRRHAEVALEL